MIFYVLFFWLEIPSELLRINIPIKCAFLVELPSLMEFIALERVTELQRIDHKSTGETCNHPFHAQCISAYGSKNSIHRFQNLSAFPTYFPPFPQKLSEQDIQKFASSERKQKMPGLTATTAVVMNLGRTKGWSGTKKHFLPFCDLKSIVKDYEVISSEIFDFVQRTPLPNVYTMKYACCKLEHPRM